MRVYTCVLQRVTILGVGSGGAAQDLFGFVPAVDKPIKLVALVLSNADPVSGGEELVPIEIGRNFGTATSGGALITPQPVGNDAPAGFTCRGPATGTPTVLASGGTPKWVHCDAWNFHMNFGPWLWPGEAPKMQIECSASVHGSMVVRLPVPFQSDQIINATAYIGEEN